MIKASTGDAVNDVTELDGLTQIKHSASHRGDRTCSHIDYTGIFVKFEMNHMCIKYY